MLASQPLFTALSHSAMAEMSYNSTTDINKVVCIAPLSGSYSIIQRWNFYITLLFVVLYRHETPLVQGAAGIVMVFSGVTAIHAFAMACFTTTHRAVCDMDIVGAWAILGPTSAVVSLMLQWSTVLTKSKARPVVQVWGLLVSVGTICSTVSIWRHYDTSYPCIDTRTNMTLSVVPSGPNPFDDRHDCTPSCFKSRQIFRSDSELVVANMSRVFDESYEQVVVWPGLLVTIAGILSLLACGSEPADRTPLQVEEDANFWTLQHRTHQFNRRHGRRPDAPIDAAQLRRMHSRRTNYLPLI